MKRLLSLLILAVLLLPTTLYAQSVGPLSLNFGDDMFSSQRIFQMLVLLTVLSVAPSLLLMVTSFTRIIIVLSFLRSALGLQSSPPNALLAALALFLTSFIMAPVLKTSYQNGVEPYLNGNLTEQVAFQRASQPFASFMLANVNEADLDLFINLLPEAEQKTIKLPGAGVKPAEVYVPLQALTPAFMISELKRAFEIGFLIFLPFLIIDLTVASILMSMGMMMLPPVTIALPFKIIFFVLVDGWHLLAGTLVESFNQVG